MNVVADFFLIYKSRFFWERENPYFLRENDENLVKKKLKITAQFWDALPPKGRTT